MKKDMLMLPLTMQMIGLKCSAVLVFATAVFAAVLEGRYIRTGKRIKNRLKN